MKILHIIPTLASGGAEKMLVDTIREMQDQGIQCEVIVLTENGNFFGEQMEKLRIPIYYGPTNKVYSICNIFFINKIIKRNKYDCIHTHLFAPQFFTPIALKMTKYKSALITTEHSTHNKRRDRKFFFTLDKWMYRQYDAIISISEGTKGRLNKYLPETQKKTIVIENGIELTQYEMAASIDLVQLESSLTSNEKIILMVAAMREQKDHETLIRASKLLPDQYRVVFVGTGDRFDEVKKYANQHGKDNIVFLGRRNDVPALMATADVFVLSSKWEGFGLVVVEAAAAGLPIVASNVEGLREVVQDIGGYLFEPGNEQDLAKGIIVSIEDKLNTSYHINLDKYTINKTVSSYIKLYKSVLKGK